MLKEGAYVYLIYSPKTARGTVHQSKDHNGKPQILFRHDPRYAEQIGEFFVSEGDVQECQPCTDAEVAAINELLKQNPPR